MRAVWVAGAIILSAAIGWAQTPKAVYKKAGPGVVLILGSDDGKAGSGGTGSIITGEGKVVTNAHVVISDATGQPYRILYVFLKPPKITGDNKRDLGNRYKARVLAWSSAKELDLAILQIEKPPPGLPTIAFADPDKVEIGDEVVAIGHPEQGGLWTLTTGTISTMIANFNRVKGKDVFQTEASVNRGNSGGPLLDMAGNMVGINTMIARQGAGGVAITDVNFSLKSSVAVKWLAGQGLGLAYAPKSKEIVLAVAPEPDRPATVGAKAPSTYAKPATKTNEPVAVEEPPPATIVVAEKPPPKPEKIREEGVTIGRAKQKQKVVSGKPLDPKKKPKYHTPKHAYSLDELRKQQMKELEDMMDDMRGKIRRKKVGTGMGLW
ncbi:S1C family serine protease [Myxococcota bacterium]